jgi:hypothetical protein
MFVYTDIHAVLGEGNFVLTVSEGQWNGQTTPSMTCSAWKMA